MSTIFSKDAYLLSSTLIIAEWLTSCFASDNVDVRAYYEQFSTAVDKPIISFNVIESSMRSAGAGRNNENSYFRHFNAPIELLTNRDTSGDEQLQLIRLSDTMMAYSKAISTGTPLLASKGLQRLTLSGVTPAHNDNFLRHIHFMRFRLEV